jgi:hypothetical protein
MLKDFGVNRHKLSCVFFDSLRLNQKSVSYFCAFMKDAGNSIFLSLFRISDLTEKTEVFGQALITDNADNQVNYIELPQA